MPFPFESYGVALYCLFMTSRSGKNELTWLIKFFVIYTFWGHLGGSKNSFIAGPKIQARWHFLTNQIRIFVLEPKNFLLISFWSGFSWMFLFCVFADWLKNIKM